MTESGNNINACREMSKLYLQCRMNKSLMSQQDMAELGFSAGASKAGAAKAAAAAADKTHKAERSEAAGRQAAGFNAGIGLVPKS